MYRRPKIQYIRTSIITVIHYNISPCLTRPHLLLFGTLTSTKLLCRIQTWQVYYSGVQLSMMIYGCVCSSVTPMSKLISSLTSDARANYFWIKRPYNDVVIQQSVPYPPTPDPPSSYMVYDQRTIRFDLFIICIRTMLITSG